MRGALLLFGGAALLTYLASKSTSAPGSGQPGTAATPAAPFRARPRNAGGGGGGGTAKGPNFDSMRGDFSPANSAPYTGGYTQTVNGWSWGSRSDGAGSGQYSYQTGDPGSGGPVGLILNFERPRSDA